MQSNRLWLEELEPRRLMASDWQNAALKCDVDNSALVSPQDALLIIDELNQFGARPLPMREVSDTQPYFDVSGDGWSSPLDALLVVNVLNTFSSQQPIVVGGLSPASDPNSNGVVLTDRVQIRGQALANSRIEASFVGQTEQPTAAVQADSQGRYVVDLPISEGLHVIQIAARDELGRRAGLQLEARRGNVIHDWNAATLDIVRQWTTFSNDPYTRRIVPSQPPMVARNLAMLHTAMFDAVNAVTGTYASYALSMSPQTSASASAAAAAAAFEVAKSLYSASDELATWQASLAESLAQEADATARDQGVAIGKQVAQALLANRANDGAATASDYVTSTEVGRWQRTFPDFLPPLLAAWPTVKTFVLASGDELRPESPPPLDSPEYALAVDEVMQLGAFASSQRTEEQREIALFWADGGGTSTPPGHWNQIATDVTLSRGTPLVETARTFALMNLAMADAGIAAWDAKYHYDLWRPIDAIRRADADNNPLTARDATWIPLLKTPPFPTYTSGHSAFSGAASAVLAALWGDATAFSSQLDDQSAAEQRPLKPAEVVTRNFDSFSQAADEAGMSRIYGGIHFLFDHTAGLQLGRAIGQAVLDRVLKPL